MRIVDDARAQILVAGGAICDDLDSGLVIRHRSAVEMRAPGGFIDRPIPFCGSCCAPATDRWVGTSASQGWTSQRSPARSPVADHRGLPTADGVAWGWWCDPETPRGRSARLSGLDPGCCGRAKTGRLTGCGRIQIVLAVTRPRGA